MSRTASVGFVTVLGVPMATSQDFVNWVCGPELDPWFLANALIASRDYLQQLASGAIHKTIYMPAVASFRVCVPSEVEEQQRIVSVLNERREVVAQALAAAREQINDLTALEPALLRSAFSGRL
jgi:type I restriction enzyme S subunit